MLDFVKLEAFALTNFRPLLKEWHFPLQRDYFEKVFTSDKPEIVLKASRQSMKSFITALVVAIYVIQGKRVVLVAPSMKQTTDIIFQNVINFLECYRKNIKSSRIKFYAIDSNKKKMLKNGGLVLTLTADPASLTDGYTCDLLVLDEAQNIQTDVVKERLQPFIIKARQEAVSTGKWHLGKIIVLGRGGLHDSYIESESRRFDVDYMKVTADDIIAQYPPYAVTVNEMRQNCAEHIFKSNFYCEPLPSDARHLFTNILVQDIKPTDFPRIGIDWGRKDLTCGVALHILPDGEWYISDIKVAAGACYLDMAKSLTNWINSYTWNEKCILCELNGVGDAATEILEQVLRRKVYDEGTHINAEQKHQRLQRLMEKSETGKLIVRTDYIAETLKGLTFKYSETDRLMKMEHNDIGSALIMAVPPEMGKAEEFVIFSK